ncbi:spore germination protein [Paenibacillus rhizoplanae]
MILFEGLPVALAADTSGWEKRSINEPTSQGVIRGPKEGFTESLRTGTSMLRRRLKTTDLRIEEYKNRPAYRDRDCPRLFEGPRQ